MKDGIYKVIFDSNVNRNGNCDGIVSIRDGHLNGGDYVCYYKGVFESNKLSLTVVRHNPNDTTVFNGADNLDLEIKISELHGGAIFNGHVKGNPSLTIAGGIHYLSELA